MKIIIRTQTLFLYTLLALCLLLNGRVVNAEAPSVEPHTNTNQDIVLGGGCFWCIEAIFKNFRGIDGVESGYAGGSLPNPTYESLKDGDTPHAEVVRVRFNPTQITLEQVLTVFFHAHNPTTKNRQGADVGPQYRSIILYSSPEQQRVAEAVMAKITEAKLWGEQSILTEIKPLSKFYRAEEYHQDYFARNPKVPYCDIVIGPKVQKIRKEFSSLLK